MRIRSARDRLGGEEQGSITLLIAGCMAIAMVLILGTIVATSAQLTRVQLLDVADSAALDAADAFDQGAYQRGVDDAVAISNATVWNSAEEYLWAAERPGRVTSWSLVSGTGTRDGQTATVVVAAQVQLPVVGRALSALGGSITITVSGTARAGLIQ